MVLRDSDVVAFVATQDAPRAREFYQNVLGLTFVADEPFALVFDANGTLLRLAKVAAVKPAEYTVLGWSVRDIQRTIKRLTERGVTFERYSGLDQDALGICTFPGGAQVAWFKDPDGNLLSLSQ